MATRTTKPSKEESAEARAKKVAEARERLTAGLTAITSGADWQATLKRMATRRRFGVGRYSFGNQIAIMVQDPQAMQVATFNAWKKVGRTVKKGEKAIYISQPIPWTKEVPGGEDKKGVSFRPLAVFAISQTDSPALSTDEQAIPDMTLPEAFEGALEALRAVALAMPEVHAIEIRPRASSDWHPTAHGWFSRVTKTIVVIETPENQGNMFATLAHEVAHAIMHGDGEDHHSRAVKEIEAESVAYMVCSVLGLDTSAMSFPYVASWAGAGVERGGDPLKSLERAGDRIVKASNRLLDAILGPVDSSVAEDTETAANAALGGTMNGTVTLDGDKLYSAFTRVEHAVTTDTTRSIHTLTVGVSGMQEGTHPAYISATDGHRITYAVVQRELVTGTNPVNEWAVAIPWPIARMMVEGMGSKNGRGYMVVSCDAKAVSVTTLNGSVRFAPQYSYQLYPPDIVQVAPRRDGCNARVRRSDLLKLLKGIPPTGQVRFTASRGVLSVARRNAFSSLVAADTEWSSPVTGDWPAVSSESPAGQATLKAAYALDALKTKRGAADRYSSWVLVHVRGDMAPVGFFDEDGTDVEVVMPMRVLLGGRPGEADTYTGEQLNIRTRA